MIADTLYAFSHICMQEREGKPVDNAVSENTTDDSEDTDQTEDGESIKFGFSVIDMQNPYFITLEEAAQQIVEKEECTMLVKDPHLMWIHRQSRSGR